MLLIGYIFVNLLAIEYASVQKRLLPVVYFILFHIQCMSVCSTKFTYIVICSLKRYSVTGP